MERKRKRHNMAEDRQLTKNEQDIIDFGKLNQKALQAIDKPVLQEKQANFISTQPESPIMSEASPSLADAPPGQLSTILSNVGANESTQLVDNAIKAQNAKNQEAIDSTVPEQPAVPSAPVDTGAGDYFKMQEASVQTALKAGRLSAAAQEAYHAERSQLAQKDLEAQKQKQAAFDIDWDKKTKEYEDTVAEMKSLANEKVYPGAFLARQDTIGAVSTGIAVALGAFAATAAGTNQNLGIDMINKAIERDIDAQKFNLDKKQLIKGKELDARNNLLVKMREKYSTDVAATAAAKATMLQLAEDKMRQQLAKSVMPLQSQAAAQSAMAQITAQKLTFLGQAKAAEMQANAMKDLDVTNLSEEQLNLMEAQNKGFRDRYVPGYGPASSKKSKEDFDTYRADVDPAIAGIKRIQELAKDYNKFTDWTTRKKLAGEASAILGSLRLPYTGPGILNEQEKEDLRKNVIGNPSDFFSVASLEKTKLQTTLNKLSSDMDIRAKQAGLNPRNTALQKAKDKLK